MKFDLHIHSCYSPDSYSKPKNIIEAAKKRGLSGIAVTDHYTIKGGLEASKANQDQNFQVIVGMEAKTDCGDIIGLFLTKELVSHKALEVIDEIHTQGGIAVLPHPLRSHELTEEILQKVDAIETFNSASQPEQNEKAVELAIQYNKCSLAGSDAHLVSEIGRCVTIFNSSDIKKEILTGKIQFETAYTASYKLSLASINRAWKKKHYRKIPSLLIKLVLNYLTKE